MDKGVILAQIDVSKPMLDYAQFRTGLTFSDVYYMIYSRQYKRRRGVLGKWREIKLKMYSEYSAEYGEALADRQVFRFCN